MMDIKTDEDMEIATLSGLVSTGYSGYLRKISNLRLLLNGHPTITHAPKSQKTEP